MKLLLFAALMLIGTLAPAAGEEYAHEYDTFEISFSTPAATTADVLWGVEKPGMRIKVGLSTGDAPYAFPHRFSTWDPRAVSQHNLVKLWTIYASGNGHSEPVITKLANGDFLVAGRMMVRTEKITRTMRTFDFDSDGELDYIVFWNGYGNFNLDLLNHLASSTKVRLIQSDASSAGQKANANDTARSSKPNKAVRSEPGSFRIAAGGS